MNRVVRLTRVCSVLAVLWGVASGGTAMAAPLLINGGFEMAFDGWTRLEATGSDGSFLLQTGGASPVTAEPVPLPPGGAFAAMTDALGPGTHVLYQDFLVPAVVPGAHFTADLFIGNRGPDFFSPETLAFSTPVLNQQARVDVIRPAADPFSVAPADVLATLFQTHPGDALVSGYTTVTHDLTSLLAAHAGQTLRLRFAEVDNVFTFQFGVDNVSLDVEPGTTIPEPASLSLLGLGLAAGAARRRRPLPRDTGPTRGRTPHQEGGHART